MLLFKFNRLFFLYTFHNTSLITPAYALYACVCVKVKMSTQFDFMGST